MTCLKCGEGECLYPDSMGCDRAGKEQRSIHQQYPPGYQTIEPQQQQQKITPPSEQLRSVGKGDGGLDDDEFWF